MRLGTLNRYGERDRERGEGLKYTGALPLADRRSLTRVEQLAAEIIEQCGFMRRNMADHDTLDRSRWMLIANRARLLLRETERGEKRYGFEWGSK